jgi:hypothetical protein
MNFAAHFHSFYIEGHIIAHVKGMEQCTLGIISLYSGTLSIAYPSDQKKILLYLKYSIICNEIYWLYIQWVLETIFLYPQYSFMCCAIKSASLYIQIRYRMLPRYACAMYTHSLIVIEACTCH